MNKLVVYSTLAVAMMAGAGCLVPVHSQDRAVQTMTLSALYNLADQQSQRVKVSEVALQAADQGVATAKAASAAELQGYVKGFDTHSMCIYWSSTEDERSYYTDYAYDMSFSEPIYMTSLKRMNYYAFTRPVIVF